MSVVDQAHDNRTQALYHEQGMGLRIPPGRRPAVLIIDMQNDFCDPDAPTTLWQSIEQTFESIKRLTAAARERGIHIIYTQGLVAYLEEGKVPAGGECLASYLAKYVVSPPISLRRILRYDGQRGRY